MQDSRYIDEAMDTMFAMGVREVLHYVGDKEFFCSTVAKIIEEIMEEAAQRDTPGDAGMGGGAAAVPE